MRQKETYDVIIIGAGPAGLSLASVLSQKNKVCILEKNKLGSTTKSWASFRDLMKKLELSQCIVNNKINVLEFKHFLGAKMIFKDIYCQLDESKLLKEFVKRCDKKNTTFIETCKVNNFSRKNKKVLIKIKDKILEAKLLVDCSGAESFIIKKFNLRDDYSSYPILGYNVKNVNIDPKKFIWEVMKTPRYKDVMIAGVMPYSDKAAQVHVFPYLKNKTQKVSSLNKYLKEYFKYYPGLKGAKIISKTQGTILMGELKKNALDNVFFFGESGLWTPRFIGTGLNEILRDYEKVGKELTKLIKENRLSEGVLSRIKPAIQEKRILHFLKCFENIVFSMRDPKRLSSFLNGLDVFHPKFGKYLLRNKFDAKVLLKSWKRIHEHFSVLELIEALPKKDVLYLFELGAELIEDSILKKYRKELKNI
ncbi:FAD-dependent monooxygenase [Candidatus Woesearchaeota archaeon]|nr:FAD-dependent monooxygenase [Candidatus Woesearchaeota archaeon]